jgi:hypothetical protein
MAVIQTPTIIAVYSKSAIKFVNTFCRQTKGILNLRAGSTHSNCTW